MITSTANLASILLCMIVVSSTTPSSHHGTLSTPQKYNDSPINEQAADKDKNEEIACISPDTNIYEIFHKAEKEARGVDMKCHFYLHNKEKSEYIGTLDVNKELFDKLLGKYNHWLLTKLDASNNGVKNARDKIDNRLSDNAEGADDNKNNHHSTHHHKPHHTKDNHHIKEIDDKKVKNKHYIELDPRYNETHRYFEVFLPKEKHRNDPRTIYINVDEDNKEFQLYENEKHREMNYKPIKIGLRELSAIADVIFSKAEAGNNVFTVNDENSEDSEKYEIKNVEYETVDKEEDAKDGNSFDLDPNTILANDSDISSYKNNTIEQVYKELNETTIDKNDKVETNVYDDSIHLENEDSNNTIDFNETDKANNDAKPYNDLVENNETEPYSDFDRLHTDTNNDSDNDTLTQVEDDENTDNATKMDGNKDKSNEEIHELPSKDTEDQENVVPIDLTRSQSEENVLRTQESYAPVAEFSPRFGNVFNNHIVPLNPTKISNIQPHSEASYPLCNALDISNNIPSNSNFDSCMRPNVLSPNCNTCNSVKIPCNSPLEELVTPNDLSQNSGSVFSPEQNLYALPNEPCLGPLCNTMNMPIQNDKNFNNVPSNVLNYNPKLQPAILNQPNQIPSDNNANYLANTAAVPIQNEVLNSLPNFNKCNSMNYNPFLQNPFSQSLPCFSPKELCTKVNKNVLLNSQSYPFGTRPISPLNYHWIKPNFPPNILSYPQYQNQNRPCLPFSNSGQIPLKSPTNTGLNLPSHSICIPNEVSESAKKFSPFNIHLSPNEDLTIDPTKYGYMTAMPFTKNPNSLTKSWVPSFKISGNNNQVFDSSEHSRPHNALIVPNLPSTSSFEDVNRNYVDKSTLLSSAEQSNLDSSLTVPHLNLNSSPFSSNGNNFNNVNVLSDKNWNYIHTSPQLNLNSSPFQSNSNNFNKDNVLSDKNWNSILTNPQMNLNSSPFSPNANNLNNINVLFDNNLDSSLTGPQLNLNTLPFASNANDFNNANVLSDTNLNSIHSSPQMNLNSSPFSTNTNNFNNVNVLSNNILDSSLTGPQLNVNSSPFQSNSNNFNNNNLNSILTSPQLNLNTLPFASNANDFNNANVLSDKNLNSIDTMPQMNLNSSPFSSNDNNFNNVNVLSNNILDSSLTGPQLNVNSPPVLSNSNKFNNGNVLSDKNLESLIKILSQSGYLVNSMGEKYLASPNALDLLNGLVEKKLLSPATLDSTLIGSGLDLNESSNDLMSDTLATSNTLSLPPLDFTLTGPGLNNLIRPLDSTLIGSNISPSSFIPDAVASNDLLPVNLNETNSLQGLNALDSSLVGPSLTLDNTGKLQPFEISPISPNVGLNILSSSYANSNVSPTDFNKDNTESIALPPLHSTLMGPKLGLPSSALDSSLIGPSLETLSSKPTLENRAPVNLIVHSGNNTGKDKIPELLESTLQSKVGIDEGEQLPQGASNIININSPNSFDTKVTTPVKYKDFNLNIKETELPGKLNVDLVNEFPLVEDEPNTNNVDITKNTGTQIENPSSIINTNEGKLTNNLNDNSKTGDLESYGSINIVEPLNKTSNLEETALGSGFNGVTNRSANEEELSGTSNTQKPEFNANLDDKIILETKEHIKLIDVSNTTNYDAKLEQNPDDTVVLYTTTIKDGDLLTQRDESNHNLKGPVKKINDAEKLKATNAANEQTDINSNTEATNPTVDEHLDKANNSEETLNGPDDTKNVLAQESRITIPNNEITALDSSLLGPSLAMSKETPLSLIGGKVDSASKGPGLFPKMIGIENIPDITVDNIIDTSLTGDSPFQNNAIEINPRLNSNINLDISLVGPGLNLDANVNLANGKEADKFNPVTGINMVNNLIEDRFLDHSLVGPTLPVDEYTPTVADKTLEYFDDVNKLQQAILSILNSGNTIDSSLTGPDLSTLSKTAEDSLDIKERPDFVTSRFTPVDSFVNKNDYNFNTAPLEYAPTAADIGSPFVCTVPSIRPHASSTPMLPSFSSPNIPYSNVLSSSYPSFSHLNLLPYTTNEYPPLFLPAPKPYESSILLNQNIPSMIPNTVSPTSLPSICTYPVFTGNTLSSVSEPKPFVSLPTTLYSKSTSILNPFSPTFSSSSSLAPYQTLAIPPQPLLNDNSFTVSKPYTYSILPSNFVAPKLPEVTINPFSTQSLSGYLPKSFVPNSNAFSSVSSTSPMFSGSTPSLVSSPTIFNSKPPFDIHTLNTSPSLLDNKPLHYLPQSLSFLDQVHPNIQSIKLPSLSIQAPNTQYLPKLSSDFQKPLYTSIINSLPADHIKIPQELKYPSAISTSPMFICTQMDLPTNKWAIPSSTTPVQNVAPSSSSMSMSMPPELPKIYQKQIPENKPCFHIPSNVPTNIPLSEWKFLTPNHYMPIISPPKVSMPSLKPECQIINSEKQTLLSNEIMSLLEQPNFDLSRNPHIPSILPPNTATTSILNSIPLPTAFKLQSASSLSPSSSMNQITPPLNSNLINYSQNLNNPLHFQPQLGTMPKEILDKQHIIPNLQFKDAHNNIIVDKETINEIECLLERDKHFDANVMSGLKEPLYSVSQGNFEPYVVDGRTPISMVDSLPFAKPMLGANNLNPPFAMYNSAPVDFKPYTIDDKAPIYISSSVPYAEPSIGVNNFNVPNLMYSLTPDKYEPCTINDKIPTPVSSPVSFTKPNLAAYTKSPYINSFMIPKPLLVNSQSTLTSTVPIKSSVPHTNENSFNTPVIETKLASLPKSNIESTSVPLSDTSSVPDNIETLRTESLILPNTKLTPLNLIKSQTEPLIKDTLPKVDSFKWSDIDLEGFKPYVEDTEMNVALPEDNNVPDERLVYSNDLFDRNHEEPFISETEELNYVEEEKDLLPYASPNRDAFGQAKSANTISPSLRVNVPQKTFNNLPIDTITPCIKYETPITTLSSPLLTPLSLASIPTYKKINPFQTSPICKNIISPLLSSSPSSINYTPCISAISMTPSQYLPISTNPTYLTIPTPSFSSPNIVSLPRTFNSYLPKPPSQLPPSSKSFLNSPVSLTNSLPDSLQYSVPIKPLAISINPTPSSAPNILQTVPFISSSQIQEQPCTPYMSKPCVLVNKVPYASPSPCTLLNSKPYVTVNKVAYPSPPVTPCSVSSLPCDNTLPSSPSVCQYPKLNSLPYITPVTAAPTLLVSQPTPLPIVSTIPVPNLDHSAYTPNYATTAPPFTFNVTPLDKKPSLTSFISPYISQMPSKPIYSPSASSSLSSSPAIQTLDLPVNPYLPYSKMPFKSTPICLNVPSLPPSVCSTPCKINTDSNNYIKNASPVEYQPFDIAYPATNTMSGIKTSFASSFVCPTETSPPLQLLNVLNPFINSVKTNPNPLTSTVQASPLISSHPSSSTFKLPCITETPISYDSPFQSTKHFIPQNIPFLSKIPCKNPIESKIESLNYPPCIINTMPSQPLSSGLLEKIQSIGIPSLPITSPSLSSYNLIKVPPLKPSQLPCTPFNLPVYSPTNTLANTPTSSPLFSTSTTVPKPYSPNQNYPPCESFNIPANSPINPLTNTRINAPKSLPNVIDAIPKPYSSIFEPAISKNKYYRPCALLHVPPPSSLANSPINMTPVTLKPISNTVLKPSLPIPPKSYTPSFESTISSNKFYPSSTIINAPESLSTKRIPINVTPTSYSLPTTTTVTNQHMPTFGPTFTPIIQTLSPPQILPSTTSQTNTKPLYSTPKYVEPPNLYSTPNICSDSTKPPIVSSILSPSPNRPLFSNLLSSLADKPLISPPKQFPITNPTCNTMAPSHIHIPSLKSPCMQGTATPSPTIYQPLVPTSFSAKSPVISPSLYQISSPILSSSKSPVTSINLLQSPPTTSNFPMNTAYNLPTPKSVQTPPFFLTPQNYRDLTQIPTPSITSHSQPCAPPNRVRNPLTPVEFLVPESRLQENEDLMTLRDLNNLPNSLNGYKPFDVDEEMIKKDIKPEEQFDKTDLYTEKDSLYDTTTEAFDYKTNEEHLEDNIHYNDNTQTYDTKYLIDNNYIQEEPMKTIQNRDRIDNLDSTNKPLELNKPTLKSGPINKTGFLEEPHHDTDDQIPEMSNKNPVINTKNAYDDYNNVNTRPMTMNLKPNPKININNLDFEPPNAVDFKEMPNLDNIKYSGYKSYQTPLANLRNTPPLIYNSRPYTDSKLGLNYNYNPTNMYAPIANPLAQPEMNFNNLDQSPTSLDLRQYTLDQPEINLNNVDQSAKSFDITTDTTDIKDSLIKYINKNDITKQNDEITVPIGNIVLVDNTPIVNNVEDFKHSGLDLKMWESHLKVVNAEVKLKCKDIIFNNFMPIVMKDNVANYADVIKKYIEDKYGNCIVMNEPYSQENRHSVLNHFEPYTVGNQFNLLWPSHR